MRTHITLLAFLTACGVQTSALAQQGREESDTVFAGRCQKAAGLVIAGGDVPAWAAAAIGECPVAGSTAIAARWKTVESDRDDLRELHHWSVTLGTLESLRGTLAAAVDPSRPVDVRLSALSAGTNYLDRSLQVVYARSPNERPAARLATVSHALGRDLGAQRSAAASLVMSTIRALATSDPVPQIREPALAIWEEVAVRLPSVAGIEPGMVQVQALCGRQFRVSNSTPIALSVGLVMDGVPKKTARIPGNGSADLSLVINDSLTITFDGSAMGSAPMNRDKCK